MAYDVKKTDHLFIPFNRHGVALRDSKNNTRIYKDLKTLEQHNKKSHGEEAWLTRSFYVDVVEYAPVQRWIPVSEPPKERDCYFVTVRHWLDGKPVTREAYWNGADWLSCDKRHELTPRVTHWMPLPEPFKEET